MCKQLSEILEVGDGVPADASRPARVRAEAARWEAEHAKSGPPGQPETD